MFCVLGKMLVLNWSGTDREFYVVPNADFVIPRAETDLDEVVSSPPHPNGYYARIGLELT